MPFWRISAVRNLLIGQTCLWVLLAVCYFISPGVVYDNNGISHFGVHESTILPYALGFLLCGCFTIVAARSIERATRILTLLSHGLVVLALLILSVLVTPFSVDSFFDDLHSLVATTLFAFEIILVGWLLSMDPRFVNIGLFLVQIFGSCLAMLAFLNVANLMFTGEFIAQVAFGILLVKLVHAAVSSRPSVAAVLPGGRAIS